ncbi:Glycerate kinase like protein [Argiope bruennichi]|uniref:Glycerate kinase n=1 Tax=Argiope bruennichi TaxID=94029 RepID=A0A8T0E7U5_ARGBR|nr:Glycerate kinase like protein [Argiope bruennichi]
MSTDALCKDARIIFETGYRSVQPLNLINKEVEINSNSIQIQGKSFPVFKNVYIVGFGKAVLGMANALETKLQEHLVSGIISVPDGMLTTLNTKLHDHFSSKSCIQVYEGASNNIPDENSLIAATKISGIVNSLKESDLLIVLISGGGSALLPAPKPPLTLKEKQKVIQLLASRGADIEELNAVRKQLSMLKGGKLALLAKPAKVISLILSDIIGDPIGMIASGPTVQNSDNPSLPLSIIEKYNLIQDLPKTAIQILTEAANQKQINESFSHVSNFVLGNNETALKAAAEKATDLEYQTLIVTNRLSGTASIIGTKLISLVMSAVDKRNLNEIINELKLPSHTQEMISEAIFQLKTYGKKLCLLFGGETTVEVKGTGLGGRNQELSLSAALELYNRKPQNSIILLSAGTDGIDGPTCAAGAIASVSLIEEAKSKGLNPSSYLLNNDSYNFYSQMNDGWWLVKTGHTGTNVMDIIIILIT